jgi:transcriptional regulator of arginine metabolism
MDRRKSLLSRRDAVKQLIKTHAIEDQTSLIELLNKHYGIETNQPAISRDLHELQVRKGMVDGQLIYEIPEIDVEAELLKLAVTDVVHNNSMIIVKTINGLPSFVADVLDRHEQAGILGTIAGENMVFVCPASNKPIEEVYDHVCEILYFKKKINKS